MAHSSSSSALGVLDALPSYEELGAGFLAFLDGLEACGANVKFIFFDGCLPQHKQTTRQERQRQSLQVLGRMYAAEVKGFKWARSSKTTTSSLRYRTLCSDEQPSLRFRGLLPPAFLVPAILDALRDSRYASRTRLVLEEADTSCARVAREEGGVILTSDSDVLVYDLGPHGAVAFLAHVHLIHEDPMRTRAASTETLKISVLRPKDIAERLGLSNLSRFAFEISQDPHVTFNEAVRRAKRSQNNAEFEVFMKMYDLGSPNTGMALLNSADSGLDLAHYQHFDPRVSIFCMYRHPFSHELKFLAAGSHRRREPSSLSILKEVCHA